MSAASRPYVLYPLVQTVTEVDEEWRAGFFFLGGGG